MEMELKNKSGKRDKRFHESLISNTAIFYVSSSGYAALSLPFFVDFVGCCHNSPSAAKGCETRKSRVKRNIKDKRHEMRFRSVEMNDLMNHGESKGEGCEDTTLFPP